MHQDEGFAAKVGTRTPECLLGFSCAAMQQHEVLSNSSTAITEALKAQHVTLHFLSTAIYHLFVTNQTGSWERKAHSSYSFSTSLSGFCRPLTELNSCTTPCNSGHNFTGFVCTHDLQAVGLPSCYPGREFCRLDGSGGYSALWANWGSQVQEVTQIGQTDMHGTRSQETGNSGILCSHSR